MFQEVADEEKTYNQTLPSPASTIESLTRELEHSLDIRSAVKGEYVVKPQVLLRIVAVTIHVHIKIVSLLLLLYIKIYN